MRSTLSVRWLAALSSGWALGCGTPEPTALTPLGPSPEFEPTASPPASATAEPSAVAGVASVASATAEPVPTGPTVPVVPLTASTIVSTRPPKPRPAWCSRGKATRLCLDKGTGTGRQVHLPSVEVDKQGCAVDEEIEGSCSGISAVLSGPVVSGAQCCYQVCQGPVPPCGRPLRGASGELRLAAVCLGEGWGGERPVAELGHDEACEWAHDALVEHASIASFARLALELVSLGAPLELVRRAHEAARDEVLHARLCFSLATPSSAPVGLGPGPLDVRGLVEAASLERLAFEAVSEGACGEGYAGELAALLAEHAREPEARATFRRVARDEARHAELALEVLGWALRVGGASALRAAREGLALGRARVGGYAQHRSRRAGERSAELAERAAERTLAGARELEAWLDRAEPGAPTLAV
jgi:hypothetical protein